MPSYAKLAIVALVAAACGGGEAEKLCRQAATKYTTCIEEVLGPSMAAMARGKQDEGIKACSRDSMTQAMYKECLPTQGCEAFLQCIDDYAMRTFPGGSEATPADTEDQCSAYAELVAGRARDCKSQDTNATDVAGMVSVCQANLAGGMRLDLTRCEDSVGRLPCEDLLAHAVRGCYDE
jgi:hypothetical protein